MNVNAVGNINNFERDTKVETSKNKVIDDDFAKQLNSILDKKDDKELKKVCKEFEGIFLQMMYKEMRATVPKSSEVDEDYGQQVYQSMLDDKIVDEAVESGGIGLGDTLYKLLKKKE